MAYRLASLLLVLIASVCCYHNKVPKTAPQPRDPHLLKTSMGRSYNWKVVLRVKVESTAQELYENEIDSAMLLWNKIAGRSLFVRTSTAPNIHVIASILEGNLAGETGCWIIEETGEINHSVVQLDPFVHPLARFRLVVHEFGHVLGLAHDEDDKESVMFPIGVEAPWKIRAEDIRYVHEQYGK